MLNSKEFDLWSDEYDNSVALSDANDTYPFAGYKDVLNEIYHKTLHHSGKNVLDIGFGTGVLTSKLYEQGYQIYGQDFSKKMIELAQKKMPDSRLYQGDLSNGLVTPLKQNKYDIIIATYSLHHLTEEQKINLIHDELEECKTKSGDEWDDEEIYFVFDEFQKFFPDMQFQKISFCAGLLFIET